MRGNPTINSVQYAPGPVPNDPADMVRFLSDELNRIAAVIQLLADGHINPSYAPPEKPRRGDFRYADGVMWDPGSGPGLYLYNGVAWSWVGGL